MSALKKSEIIHINTLQLLSEDSSYVIVESFFEEVDKLLTEAFGVA